MKSNVEILQKRAELNAIPEIKHNIVNFDLLEFKVVNTYYAIEEKYLKEVFRIKDITPLPGTPDFVLGLINKRGEFFSVINIQVFLEQKEIGISDLNKVIIISANDTQYGILCDSISGSANSQEFSSVLPSNFGKLQKEFIKGINQAGVLLLDGEALTTSKKIIIEQ